eukprot:1108573-Lingulodinium_polyedra.AAC.1
MKASSRPVPLSAGARAKGCRLHHGTGRPPSETSWTMWILDVRALPSCTNHSISRWTASASTSAGASSCPESSEELLRPSARSEVEEELEEEDPAVGRRTGAGSAAESAWPPVLPLATLPCRSSVCLGASSPTAPTSSMEKPTG